MKSAITQALVVAVAATVIVSVGFVNTAFARQQPPPKHCESDAGYSQFDFWVGNWDVFGPNGGQAGVNIIEKVENGCLIKEHWTSAGGGTGFSMNYYNSITGKWRQVWVSRAVSIDYTGGLNDQGAMVLEGTIYYQAQGTSFPFRGTWTLNTDGSVRQFFEQFNPEAGEWATWFDGKYVRRKEAVE